MKPFIDQIVLYLNEGLNNLNIFLSDEIKIKLAEYFELLIDVNKNLNLISSKQDLQTQVLVHLVDSLSFMLFSGWLGVKSVLDIGSGGGLPGIPMALVKKEWSITLVDSTAKKTNFLIQTVDSLKIKNVTVLNKYLIEGKNGEKKVYDLITARAVSETLKIISLAAPRLSNTGQILLFKGPKGYGELEASGHLLKKYNLKLITIIDFILPIVEARRSLFIIGKCST